MIRLIKNILNKKNSMRHKVNNAFVPIADIKRIELG